MIGKNKIKITDNDNVEYYENDDRINALQDKNWRNYIIAFKAVGNKNNQNNKIE